MASKVDICNMALMRIGVSTIISDINEGSQESNVCAQFFDATLDYILRDYPWNFAEVRVTLAQAAGDPPTNWAFKYAYPSDCLAAIAITIPGLRTPTAAARVPFKVAFEPGVGFPHTSASKPPRKRKPVRKKAPARPGGQAG